MAVVRRAAVGDGVLPGEGGATAVDVPIVALTAHVGQAERDSCRDAGMTDYLSKPFGIDALAEMARTYLDPRQAEADPAT